MKKLSILLAVLVLSLASFVGCSCNKNNDNVLRVNEVTHSIFYAPFYVAINQGYFEDEGYTIELTNGGGSDKSMTAILSGSADIALLGPETSVYVASQGKQDLPIVFGQLTKRDGSFLVGRTQEDDFDWSNLAGTEIIAGRQGGLPAMTLEYVLNQKGYVNGENITLNFDISFNNMGPAFVGGTGDYTTLFEPTATEVEKAGNGHIVASVGEESGEVPYTCFMANRSYLNKNSDTIKKFLRAVMKGYQYLTTASLDDAAKALAPSFEGTDLTSIKYAIESYKAIDAWTNTPVMTEDSYNRLLAIMQNAGQITGNVAFSTVVDNSFANAVIAEL